MQQVPFGETENSVHEIAVKYLINHDYQLRKWNTGLRVPSFSAHQNYSMS